MRINSVVNMNIEKIIKLFLWLQPFIDVLTAIMLNIFKINLTIGLIFRCLFLMFVIYYLIFISNSKYKKITMIYILFIFIYFILYVINIYNTKSLAAIPFEMTNTIKTFYFPFIFIFFLNVFEEKNIKIKFNFFIYIAIIYLLFVFIPNLLKIGFDSYKYSKVGSIGLFNATNEIGCIISFLLPFIIGYMFIDKKKIKKIFLSLLTLVVLFMIGTKVPVLSLVIIMIFTYIWFIYYSAKQKKYHLILYSGIMVIFMFIGAAIIIPKTPFYKNIKIHLDFLNIHKMDEILDVSNIDHFVFSKRLTFLRNTQESYEKADVASQILGIGYIENYHMENESTKLIEMDYYDILYRHGIGFLLYFSLPVVFILRIVDDLKKIYSIKHFAYVCSLMLILLLALFSGHVFTSPSVSIWVSLIIVINYNYLKDKLTNE